MERRWGLRKPIDVDVVIDNQPANLLHGRIGNVSVGGLFVRTDAKNLQKNAQVELVLMLQQDNGTRVYRMPAMVVRLTQEGAGLMFDEYDVNAFRALVVLLVAKKAAEDTRGHNKSLSIEGGSSAASVLEGTTGSYVPVSQQPSPVHGE